MKRLLARLACVIGPVLLTACAASSMPGYQNVYRSYNVPEPLVQQIRVKFASRGLTQATVGRDNTGRIQLTGTYRDEDEVDTAFLIVQSIVGIKSTSPFYPEHILKKRWEVDAAKALTAFNRAQAEKAALPVKRALVIGINHFADPYHLHDILGADDAAVVQRYLQRAGYQVTALLNQQATKANIEAAIARLSARFARTMKSSSTYRVTATCRYRARPAATIARCRSWPTIRATRRLSARTIGQMSSCISSSMQCRTRWSRILRASRAASPAW